MLSLSKNEIMEKNSQIFSNELIREINKINIKMETTRCRQLSLFNASKLSTFSKKNKTSYLSDQNIKKLWQVAFLQADIVVSSEPIEIEGLILMQKNENTLFYADERQLTEKQNGYANSFDSIEQFPQHIEILFHPFRCYVLYHIDRIFEWTSESKFYNQFQFWNNLVSLCAISETSAHNQIFQKIRCNGFDSYESIVKKLIDIQNDVSNLYNNIGEKNLENFRSKICRDAEEIDPNKNLHLIIRLMKSEERERLEGHIAGAMLFITMAESLRRNLERTNKKEYSEEDECGFGEVNRDTKLKLQGSTRILDGNRLVANQFLRRFGLDYGIRLNIYVEGLTEYAALSNKFKNNNSVLVINLKGNFVEKNGKGVAFRESLRNDIKAKIFSLILLDGDVSDNLRAVKQAAKNDEICGMFFVSNPDFEFENFTKAELVDIVCKIALEQGITSVDRYELIKVTRECNSAKAFFANIHKISSEIAKADISKGANWGEALLNYAINNPRSGVPFGCDKDRKLNQVVKVAYQCCSFTYETTRQINRVDPVTGKLKKR